MQLGPPWTLGGREGANTVHGPRALLSCGYLTACPKGQMWARLLRHTYRIHSISAYKEQQG